MTIELVKGISEEALKTLLLVSGPALIVSLIVGLFVSFLQAITQIQEYTLTFVPKVIAVFICIFFMFPWMAKILISFTIRLVENIPLYIR